MKVIKDGKVEPATMVIRNRNLNLADDSVTESNLSQQIFDVSLDMIKPVLKRSLYHLGNPVIVVFKSFEVWLVNSTESGGTKIHNPIYLPLQQASELSFLSENAIEQHVVRHLRQGTRGFFYQPSGPISGEKCDEQLPDQIQTSLYLQSANSDFKVAICPPVVEYHISAKNFTFVKTLTRPEIQSLVEHRFTDWERECLHTVTSVKNF